MAENSNLPILNALQEQSAESKDQRERLQKSLRAGLLNVVKSVDRLNDAFIQQMSMNEQWRKEQMAQSNAAELARIEAEREAARSGGEGGGDGDVTVNGDVTVDASKGGLLSGLGKSLGGMIGGLASGVGLGAGAFLAGAGILAGGAGYLLKQINELDGANIKRQVLELLSIADEFEGGNWEMFAKGGAFLVTMTGIGLGLAVFGAGSAVAGMSDALLERFNSDWATSVKNNVITLLSIKDSLGGNLDMMADGGAFLLAMTGIGLGLAIFGLGSGIAGLADGLTNFVSPNWAESIKQNVITLLSIKDELGGNLNMMADGGAFMLAMTGLGIGLAVFGAGSAVAGLSDALTSFMNPDWASSIKNSVITLLSIKDEMGGNWEMLKSGFAFGLAMSGIGSGLAVFGAGAAVAGLSDALTSFMNPQWAIGIKNSVLTLLSIQDELGGAAAFIGDSATFLMAMTGIGAGLAVFGLGSGVAAFVRMFTGDDFAGKIKSDVDTLMTVADNATPEKADQLHYSMSRISDALQAFAGGQLGSALANIGTSILNFLSGSESPVTEMLNLADKADELTTAADALESLADSLASVSALKFDGGNLNFKEFAQDLYDSVPLIEAAIQGGRVDGGWFGDDVEFKGLSSPDINFESAIQRVEALQRVLSGQPAAGGAGGMRGAQIAVESANIIVRNAGGGGGAAPVIAPTTVNNNSTRTNNSTVVPASPVPNRPAPAYGDSRYDF